ncbi:hypothetical protein H4R33_006325 [Dimargaris cristalligena]|uniref:Extracellular membrane protein CFEM domain-containing protein n=1 Tax=Dimargaris cristalligena TaxID=215637 RepID=A0A4P9ZM27_9FUNG|nr:hypothetical protein H4R33_006325 [Dimargaris cristalligena]RKP34347.1 hypothetical protein BJ085DRAFT_39238 [Dimargaris cristalligena]|eukprot:RKP34347.1 hypothetical protein BJ085DRAFT_39238 [Dimargaris cristalligena]
MKFTAALVMALCTLSLAVADNASTSTQNTDDLTVLLSNITSDQKSCMNGPDCEVSTSKCFAVCFNATQAQLNTTRECLNACPGSQQTNDTSTTFESDECSNGCFLDFFTKDLNMSITDNGSSSSAAATPLLSSLAMVLPLLASVAALAHL